MEAITQDEFMFAIGKALLKQEDKFGSEPIATNSQFAHILGEEYGEVCRAINQDNRNDLIKECSQCCAVIIAHMMGQLHYGTQK
jgi:NTP pyrophosphatase (non-canonical NTP hydrolase)